MSEIEALQEELIEKVAESDEELMDKFFEEGTLPDEDLDKGLKAAMINGSFVPVFAMSGSKGVGIEQLP